MWFWRRFFSFSVLTVSFGLGLGLGLEPLWTRTRLGLEPLWTWTWLGLEPLWTWTCLGLDKGGLDYSPSPSTPPSKTKQREFSNYSLLMALFHCMVRYGTVRHGSVRYGSVRVGLHFHHSLVPLSSGRDYSRVVIIAPPLLPWHHRKRATNKLTTKKGDGIVFFILGMWMFLTAMERSMRMLVIYPQQQRLWWQWHGL